MPGIRGSNYLPSRYRPAPDSGPFARLLTRVRKAKLGKHDRPAGGEGRMDPGEPAGTRDEHYDLISALYHALKGADACASHALDAGAAGRTELVEFFRDAQ